MKKRSTRFVLLLLFFPALLFGQESAKRAQPENMISLRDGWALQSSAKTGETGDILSTPQFQPKGWYAVTVPTTVFAAQVKNKVFPDPGFGMNLRSVPGVSYPIGDNFSNYNMQPDSPYAVPWWYRKEFTIPASFAGKSIWLKFNGINYRASVWLNGKNIAKPEEIAGAWRTPELNITDSALPGKANVLAVEVWSPTDTDLAITFVDWNPAPPDKNMGLWRSVEVTSSGPAALRYPAVMSKVNSPASQSDRPQPRSSYRMNVWPAARSRTQCRHTELSMS